LIREKLNPTLSVEGVLLTMFDARNNLAHQVVNDIRANLTNSVFDTMIPRNVRLSEAPSFGKPIILYDINSKGSISYLKLTKEILSRNGGV
jgi:chromosome partitioning protein